MCGTEGTLTKEGCASDLASLQGADPGIRQQMVVDGSKMYPAERLIICMRTKPRADG